MNDLERRTSTGLATDDLLARARALTATTTASASASASTSSSTSVDAGSREAADDAPDVDYAAMRVRLLIRDLRQDCNYFLQGSVQQAFSSTVWVDRDEIETVSVDEDFEWSDDLSDEVLSLAMDEACWYLAHRLAKVPANEFIAAIGVWPCGYDLDSLQPDFNATRAVLAVTMEHVITNDLDNHLLDLTARCLMAVFMGCAMVVEPFLFHADLMVLATDYRQMFVDWGACPEELDIWTDETGHIGSFFWEVPPLSDLAMFGARQIEIPYRALYGPMIALA